MMINFGPIVLLTIKIIILSLLFFYSIFAWVAWRKVKFLSQVVETEVSPVLIFILLVNLFLGLILFLTVLFVL